MIALLWAAAALAWSGLSGTADTVDRGDVVLRPPTGRSGVGVGPTTEVFAVPFDLTLLGTRAGVEQALLDGPVTWSVSPSLGASWSLARASFRVDTHLSVDAGRERFHASVGADLRTLRQARLSDQRSHAVSVQRLHVPIGVSWDHAWTDTIVRTEVRVSLLDAGRPLTHGVASAQWIHRWGRFHLALGAGVLVGRPSEQVFLGRYLHTLVFPYPRVDLWVRL